MSPSADASPDSAPAIPGAAARDDADLPWQNRWTPEERESFYAAIARHRRASWRVTAVAAAAIALLAFVVAVLMAPLLYGLLGLATDVVNLVVPVPNVLGALLNGLGDAIDRLDTTPWRDWLRILAVASLPGLAAMALVVAALARALRSLDEVEPALLLARLPDPARLAERRFANVVAEMALAAQLPVPRVLVSGRAALNAVALGSERQATLVVSRSLLETLDRDAMQGVAAHLVATLANGDLRAGGRVALSLGLFGLITRLTGAIMDPRAAATLPRLALAALRPGPARARELLVAISNPFGGEAGPATPADSGARPAPPAASRDGNRLTWREWAAMPFTGPLVMSGFLGGLVSSFMLSPLLAFAWRQRKYLADSTAVRLTRDPDTLAAALQALAGSPGGDLAPWAAHLAVVRDGGATGRNLLSTAMVPMFPSLERRLKALARLGASVSIAAGKPVPPVAWLVGVPLGLVVASLLATVVVLLLYVSLALSALFTILPVAALHALLRWTGS